MKGIMHMMEATLPCDPQTPCCMVKVDKLNQMLIGKICAGRQPT